MPCVTGGLDQGGWMLCFVSPARFAGSSFTYAEHPAALICLQAW